MKIELSPQQLSVLKDIVLMIGDIQITSIIRHVEVDGWFGKGSVDYNANEHNAKVKIELPEEVK